MTTAFPLQWPDGWPRTKRLKRSGFKCTFGKARDGILHELRLFGVPRGRIVISSNIELRRDGLPYANQPEPNDVGIAVYFRKHTLSAPARNMTMACDRWDRARDNLRAIQKSIEAMRGMKRWGTSEIVDRAFEGFAQLPPGADDWRFVFGFGSDFARQVTDASLAIVIALVKERYREQALKAHPDHGGNEHEMQRINQAMAAAKKEMS